MQVGAIQSDDSGKITMEALRSAMQKENPTVTEDDVAKRFAELDVDGDGVVQYMCICMCALCVCVCVCVLCQGIRFQYICVRITFHRLQVMRSRQCQTGARWWAERSANGSTRRLILNPLKRTLMLGISKLNMLTLCSTLSKVISPKVRTMTCEI